MTKRATDTIIRQKLAAEAARAKEVSETQAWNDLSILSANTVVETLEIFEDEVVFDGNRFRGPLIWHVTLHYGNGEDAFASSESFPGTFQGEVRGKNAVITEMTAETSSFYQ